MSSLYNEDMKHEMKFRTFLEEFKDIFGVEAELRTPDKPKMLDEKPIQAFNSTEMMEHLASLKAGTHPHGFQDFSNTVQWGTNPGAVRVRIGSQYTVYVERLLVDLDNNHVWTTKRVFRINVDGYKQYAEAVGDAIHDEVDKIIVTGMDAPQRRFNDVHELAEELAEAMQSYANDMFVFDQIRKVTDNNSLLVYVVKGGGVGALQNPRSQGRINQIVSDISFNEATGLIRIMNTSVQTGDEGVSWHIMPSFFEGMFAPTQDRKEIAEAVVTSMKWF